jgi:hypothetical protein
MRNWIRFIWAFCAFCGENAYVPISPNVGGDRCSDRDAALPALRHASARRSHRSWLWLPFRRFARRLHRMSASLGDRDRE